MANLKTLKNSSVPPGFPSFVDAGFDFYNLDEQTVVRVAISYIGDFPLVKRFDDVSRNEIIKIVSDFGFLQVVGWEDFNKETKGYDAGVNGYMHPTQKAFIGVFFREDIDDYSSESSIDESSIDEILGIRKSNGDRITNVHLYFTPGTDPGFLKDASQALEKAALLKLQAKPKKNHINFLCFDHNYRLKSVKVNRKFQMDLPLNYGDEFIKIHDHLLKFLNSDESGLAILHGVIGSGKTSYLRYLLGILEKKVIYVPPHLINRVAEPDFLSFLLKQNDFILLIEDAEEIVTNREDTKNTAGVSNLLNLSDGILGDCIKARCIVTFNTEVKNIDPALLSKGRLKLEYEFGKLSPDQGNRLLQSLGSKRVVTEHLSLAEIYNEEENFRKEKVTPVAGFGAFKKL